MIIHLEYASKRLPDGRFIVKPFCYTIDDSHGEDGGASVRDANYALHLTHAFTSKLIGDFSTEPPSADYKPVFRIVLEVLDVRGKNATYNVRGYQRMDCSAVFNGVCQGYMELYYELKHIIRKAKRAQERARAKRKEARG